MILVAVLQQHALCNPLKVQLLAGDLGVAKKPAFFLWVFGVQKEGLNRLEWKLPRLEGFIPIFCMHSVDTVRAGGVLGWLGKIGSRGRDPPVGPPIRW